MSSETQPDLMMDATRSEAQPAPVAEAMSSEAQHLPAGRVARKRLLSEPFPGGHPMEIWISFVLRGGVLVAGAIIAAGLLLYVIRGPGQGQDLTLQALRVRGGHPLAVHPSEILRGALSGNPTAIIQAGLLTLILTPIMRVAMTVGLFLAQRDAVFIAITAVVLTILVLGLVGVGS